MIHLQNKNDGFTLVELLVVISIIALLSSIVFAATNIARAKGRDAKKKEEAHQVANALNAYFSDHASMPPNYTCSGGSCSAGRATIAVENTDGGYERSMQDLVDGGYLSAIPHSPGGDPYAYYDYGPNTNAGALFGTRFEIASPSATGQTGSCRPFDAGFGLCTMIPEPRYTNPGTGSEDPCPYSFGTSDYNLLCYVHAYCSYNGTSYKQYMDNRIVYDDTPQTLNNWCNNNTTNDFCTCNPY